MSFQIRLFTVFEEKKDEQSLIIHLRCKKLITKTKLTRATVFKNKQENSTRLTLIVV